MREILKELTEIVKTVVPSAPVYKVVPYYDGIRLDQVFKPTVNSTSFLTELVRHQLSEELNIAERCNKVRTTNVEDLAQGIRYAVRSTLLSFTRVYQETKNNKLTTLYRWYNEFCDSNNMKRHEQFDNDMYNVFKYIKTAAEISEGR